MAYTALVSEEGTIILSDQLALIGEEAPLPSDTQIEEMTCVGRRSGLSRRRCGMDGMLPTRVGSRSARCGWRYGATGPKRSSMRAATCSG